MESPLTPILKNLVHVYPHPQLNEDWLQNCLDGLLLESPGLSRQMQIKSCNERLLMSDLATSTLPQTGFPEDLFDEAEGGDPQRRTLFGGSRQGCLVMIVSITEIGASAFNLERTLRDRQEARSGVAKIRRLVGEEVEDEVDEGEQGPRYPRAMLKLGLSDGHSEVVYGIERKHIPGLKLGETRLGCKILLQNVPVSRKLLLLSPETAIVKGFHVPALCQGAQEEKMFEKDLAERLGREVDPPQAPLAPADHVDPPLDPVAPPDVVPARPPPPPPAPPPPPRPRPPQPAHPVRLPTPPPEFPPRHQERLPWPLQPNIHRAPARAALPPLPPPPPSPPPPPPVPAVAPTRAVAAAPAHAPSILDLITAAVDPGAMVPKVEPEPEKMQLDEEEMEPEFNPWAVFGVEPDEPPPAQDANEDRDEEEDDWAAAEGALPRDAGADVDHLDEDDMEAEDGLGEDDYVEEPEEMMDIDEDAEVEEEADEVETSYLDDLAPARSRFFPPQRREPRRRQDLVPKPAPEPPSTIRTRKRARQDVLGPSATALKKQQQQNQETISLSDSSEEEEKENLAPPATSSSRRPPHAIPFRPPASTSAGASSSRGLSAPAVPSIPVPRLSASRRLATISSERIGKRPAAAPAPRTGNAWGSLKPDVEEEAKKGKGKGKGKEKEKPGKATKKGKGRG